MLIYQFGIIQNLQMSPIPQTSLSSWTSFCSFLQQDRIFINTKNTDVNFIDTILVIEYFNKKW